MERPALPPYVGFCQHFRIRPVMPSSHPPSTMRSAKEIWPHRQKARLSARLFRSSDMLFTKCSQNGAQIERTKGFDPIQRARHARAFCCQPFPQLSSPISRMESKLRLPPNTRTGCPIAPVPTPARLRGGLDGVEVQSPPIRLSPDVPLPHLFWTLYTFGPEPACAVRREGCPPYDTVHQIHIPNYVFAGEIA